MSLRTGVSWVTTATLAVGLIVAPGAATTPASAACGSLASVYRATVSGSYSNSWGVSGSAVIITGTGSASITGTSTLTGASGSYSGPIAGTAAMNYDETSSGQQYSETAIRTLPDTSASSASMSLTVDPTTCHFELGITTNLEVATQGQGGAGTALRSQALRVVTSGTLVPGGTTTGSVSSMPGGICSTAFGGWPCKFDGIGVFPSWWTSGSATGSLTYTISLPEPTITLNSVVPQHQADGVPPWTVVTESGMIEGEPLRLVARFTSDRPLAATARVTEVGGGGFSTTFPGWRVTKGGHEAWGAYLNLPPIPRSVGTVERTFQLSVLYCPTSSGCDIAKAKETALRQVRIVMHPAVTITSLHYETRSSPTAEWRRVPLVEGVWRGDPLRLVMQVNNASATTRAFGIRISQVPATPRTYSNFWLTAPPGERTVRVGVNSTNRTDVFLRTLLVQLEFCSKAAACTWGTRRLTFLSGATYTESPRLQIIIRGFDFNIAGGTLTQNIPVGATYVRTGLPEFSSSKWKVRVINRGPALYHRLSVKHVGARLAQTLPGRLTASGPLGVDFTMPIDGVALHSGRPATSRTFEFVADVCPSTTRCTAAEVRRVTSRISIGTQPNVVFRPEKLRYIEGNPGGPVWVTLPDSKPVYTGIGERKPFTLEFATQVAAGPVRYRMHVRELTAGVGVRDIYSEWRTATSEEKAIVSVPVGPVRGGFTARTFDTWVEYCPYLTPMCQPAHTVSTAPRRVAVRVLPNQ